MSRGFYASDDILYTERQILKTLSWYVNPTTALSFCRVYWELFPVPPSVAFQSLCQALAEMALADVFFLRRKTSLIGLGIILHAPRTEGIQATVTEEFWGELQGTLNLKNNQGELEAICRRLEFLSSR
jgi:hypothetical protein